MANTNSASSSRSIIDELNALRERHSAPAMPAPSAIDELHNTLAELERRLGSLGSAVPQISAPEVKKTDKRIEGLAEIAEHLRQLKNQQNEIDERDLRSVSPFAGSVARQPLADIALFSEQNALNLIDSRLDEISRALVAANRHKDTDHEEALRLERIERHLSQLTQQLDNSTAEQNADILFRRLGELSQRIDSLSEGTHLPEQAVDQLARQINLLAHHVGKVMENLSQSDFSTVETRLDAIAQKLEAAEKWAREPNPSLVEKMDNRFRELTKRLDAQYASHYADGGVLHTLENRLDDISQQISLSLLQSPQPIETALAESEAIRGLESQIANLARQLSQPSAEITEITPRLDAIERSIADNRTAVLDAAREAAESAIAQVLKHGSQKESATALQLANDMKSLEALARSADERNGQTFEAVHNTLVKVVERLTGLEKQMSAEPQGAPKAKPVVTNPYSVAENSVSKTAPQASATPDKGETVTKLSPKLRQEPEITTALDSVQPDNDSVLDLNTIMKRVREERVQHDEIKSAPNGKADLISVARRAALQAAEESSKLRPQPEQSAEKKKGSISDLFSRQRKPILMAIGAVMLAIAGLQFGSSFIAKGNQPEVLASPETPEIDTNTTASVTPSKETVAPTAVQQMPEVTTPATSLAAPKSPEFEPEVSDATPALEQATTTFDVPADAGPEALREAAIAGDARALFEIGNRYMEGRGGPENLVEAAKWFEKSAAKGFAPALYRLGNFNEKGLGMPRNITQAISWYQQAAKLGNASAMHNLAVLFASGASGAPDNASAVRWFIQAAELGVKDSQYNLGILAAKGLGMQVNLEESYKWFALAAKAGDKDAADKRDQIGAAFQPQQLERAKGTVELWKAKTLNQEANSFELPEEWSDQKPVAAAPADMKKAVRNIQLILKKNGYDVGSADGVMGNKTRNAIAEIQKANGQEPTGEVNQQLVELLLEKNK